MSQDHLGINNDEAIRSGKRHPESIALYIVKCPPLEHNGALSSKTLDISFDHCNGGKADAKPV
jgi:hypothetical protein